MNKLQTGKASKSKELSAFLSELDNRSVRILSEPEDRRIYSHGCYPVEYKWMLQGEYPFMPSAILQPTSVEEVSEIVRLATEKGIPLIPYGGGSGIVGGTIARNGEVIVDTKGLSKIEIHPRNMTVTAGAGVTGAELENYVNRHGYTTGHYPQSFQSACLGGMVATRAIGTFSTKYGKMEDIVTGLEVVIPGGDVFRSHPAPARSTGPELNELFLGSEGVYGVITEVTLKIHPVAEKRHLECYTFSNTPDALNAIRHFMRIGLRPPVVRLYDEEEAAPKIAALGYEEGYVLLILGYEGIAEFVDLEIEKVGEICRGHGGIPHGRHGGVDWFESRFSTKGMLEFDARTGDTADAIEVAAPWDKIEGVWREMRSALEPLCDHIHCHFSHFYHHGASVYVIFHAKSGGDDKDGERLYERCLRIAIETSLANGGNVSHHHGVGTAKAAFMEGEHGPAGMKIMKLIKDSLDPKGILNKGVLGV